MTNPFWKGLAKVGLVTIEDDAVTTAVPESEASPQPITSRPPPRAAATGDRELVAALDTSSRDQLVAAMEASGAQLVEDLMDMIGTLRENISDETALYKAALKILIKQGNTVSAIRQDFDKCIGALEATSRDFAAQLKAQLDKRVGGKLKIAQDCKAQMAAKQQQIETLQNEVANLAAQAHEAESSVADEQAKLDLAQQRFTHNYTAIRGEIEGTYAKVAQHGEQL
jgi:chromosome segregation ATPase